MEISVLSRKELEKILEMLETDKRTSEKSQLRLVVLKSHQQPHHGAVGKNNKKDNCRQEYQVQRIIPLKVFF